MPLRSVNNPNTDIAIMNTLKYLLPVNTVLASSDHVFVQARHDLYLFLSQGNPIALHLSSGVQSYKKAEWGGFDGQAPINIDYYASWDDQLSTIDAAWQAIAEDIERVKSNAEDNDHTEYQGANHTMSIARTTLGSYEDQYDRTFPDYTFIFRRLSILYNLLPYGVGGV
jgi:hypothetical protein